MAVEILHNLVGVVVVLLRNRQNHGLVRRKPQRELAGRMLEQDSHETLHRAERRTVNHYRAVELVVGTLVGQIETLREVVVNLYRTELPAAAEGVLDHEVEFRAVECGLAILHDGLQSLCLRRLNDGVLGLLPVLVRTDILRLVVRVAQRNLCRILVELERLEYVEHDVDYLLELIEQLVRTHEHVGVVLREAAHAGESVKLARLLVAVNRSELGQTHRKILVRVRLTAVYLAVVRTVHRLEQVLLAL